jgi:hypothetical protein
METRVALAVVAGALLLVLLVHVVSRDTKTSSNPYLKSRKLKKKEIQQDPLKEACSTVPLRTVVSNHVLSHSQHKTKKKVLVTGA